MLEIKNNKVTDYAALKAARGSDKIGSTKDYLKGDPVSYYYDKFKQENNPYLRDDMWAEAAKRGESNQLIQALELAKDDIDVANTFNRLKGYESQLDYDTYMLTLSLPMLDDENVEDIKTEQGDIIGSYTKKQYASEVIKQSQLRWDAEILEADKDNMNWFLKAGATVAAGANHVAAGVLQFGQDIHNLVEGLVNVATGQNFLAAFADDEGELLADLKETIDVATFEFERQFTNAVDAVKAYEQGYMPGTGDTMAKIVDTTINTGVGYTTWGRWWAAGTESLGYMLPSMLLPIKGFSGKSFALKGAKTTFNVGKTVNIVGTGRTIATGATRSLTFGNTLGKTAGKSLASFGKGLTAKAAAGLKHKIFYAGVFSGMVGDTVRLAEAQGISYKDLNTGEVIGNAAIKTLAQIGVEKALGMIMGFSGLDRLMGATSTEGSGVASLMTQIGQKGISALPKAAGAAFARGTKDMLKEGLEETLQDLSNGLIDIIMGGVYSEQGMETISIQNLVDSFVVGALTSGVIGSVKNASVMLPRNRAYSIGDDGKTFKLGFFQTLNYNDAMRSMADWREILDDKTASAQEKANAAFKLNSVMATVGNVLKHFGTERTKKANELLALYQATKQAYKKGISTKQNLVNAKTSLSDENFAKELYAEFLNKNSAIITTRLKEERAKVEEALKKVADKLKAAEVTEITNTISKLTKKEEVTDIADTSLKKMQAALKPLGVSLIVGINGNVVVKSGDIIFADDALVKTGNIAEIVKGISYEDLIADITDSIKKDKNVLTFVKNSYKNVTGNDPRSDQTAVTALLFDQNFYLYCLLNATESGHNDILKSLSKAIISVNNKIKIKSIPANKVLQQAYKTLFEKVVKNMQNALLTYYTQYQRLDVLNLNEISKVLITEEMRKIILEHKNVIFSNNIDNAVKAPNAKIGSQSRAQWFETQISKLLGLSGGEFDDLIRQAIADIKTNSQQKRRDAAATLVILTEYNATLPADRRITDVGVQLTYLPVDIPNNRNVSQVISQLETETGLTFNELRTGDILENSTPSAEFIDYLNAGGYDFNNKESRIAAVREMMYYKSGGKYTLSSIGEVQQIIDKKGFMKAEYANNETKLQEDIKSGKIKKIGDILEKGIKLAAPFKEIAIVYKSNITGLGYSRNGTKIFVGNKYISETIMHEFTHCLQDDIAAAIINTGGNDKLLKNMKKSEKAELTKYITENYPTANALLNRLGENTLDLKTYHLLDGELQACSNTNSIIFECGFKLSYDKTKLISPTGEAFSLIDKPTTKLANRANSTAQRSEFDREKAMSYLTKLIEADNKARIKREDRALDYMTPFARVEASKSKVASKRMSEALGGEKQTSLMTTQDVKRSVDAFNRRSGEVHKAIDTPMKKVFDSKKGYGELKEKDLLGTEQQRIDAIELSSQGTMKMPSPLDKRYKRRYSYGTIAAEKAAAEKVSKEDKARDSRGKVRQISKEEFEAKTAYGGTDWQEVQKQLDQYNKEVAEYEKAIAARKRLIRKAEKRQAKLSEEAKAKKEAAIRYTVQNRPAIRRDDYVKTPKPIFTSKQSMINKIGERNADLAELLKKTKLTKDNMTKVFDSNEGYTRYKKRDYTEAQGDKAYVDLMHGHLGTKALKDLTASMNVSRALRQSKAKDETKKLTRSEMQAELLDKVVQMRVAEYAEDFEDPMKPYEIAQLRKTIRTKLENMSNAEINRYYKNVINPINDTTVSERRGFGAPSKKYTVTGEEDSRIKNWHRKGQQTRIDDEIRAFVEATDDNFNKLHSEVKYLINDQSLNSESINRFVGRTHPIDDYTFQNIAKYFFFNEHAAQLTYEQMIEILDHLDEYIATGKLLAKATDDPGMLEDYMTYDVLKELRDTLKDKSKNPQYDEWAKLAHKAWYNPKNKNSNVDSDEGAGPITYSSLLHKQFLERFDGSISSLIALNKIGKSLYKNANIGAEGADANIMGADKDDDVETNDIAAGDNELAEYEGGFKWNVNKATESESERYDTFEEYVSKRVSKLEKQQTIYKARRAETLEKAKKQALEQGQAWNKELATQAKKALKRKIAKLSDEKLDNMYIKALSADTRSIEDKRLILANIEAKRLADDFGLDNVRNENEIEELTRETIEDFERDYSDEQIQKMYDDLVAKYPEYGSQLDALQKSYEGYSQSQDKDLERKYANKRAPRIQPTPYGTHASKQTQKDTIRHSVENRLLSTTNGLNSKYAIKSDYDMLPDNVKAVLDKKSPHSKYYVFNDKYLSMSQEELEQLSHDISEAATRIQKRQRDAMKLANKAEERIASVEAKMNKLQAKNKQLQSQLKQEKNRGTKAVAKTYNYYVTETVVVQANMPEGSTPDVVNKIMHTTWNKTKKSEVKELNDNIDYIAKNGETFYKENNEALYGITTSEAEAAADWFIKSSIPVNQEGSDVYEAVRFYFMGFLYREMQEGGQFENMSANMKQQITEFMNRTVHFGATILGIWHGLKNKLDPLKAIFSARLEIAGVELTRQEQNNLLEAARSNDINKINEIQAEIINRIKAEKLNKNTIGKSILTIRNMAMLSSPLTWLRNRISNFMLKRLNKWSSVIGNKIWTRKTDSDQLKMTKAITPEITKFINENFVDNGLFSSIVENLSKYNPSDVQNRFKTASGAIDKEAIFANMVIKSMYNKFYNENMFSDKFGFLNKTHQFLMKQLSDNNYVREAALRYFGQLIAERGYKLSEGVTDEVMTDFANAIGMGMSDYMHSDNFLNAFERIIAEKGAGWQFAYKLLMPFAATSWNWMKAALRYSPAGLIKSIYQLATLERTIGKATASWDKGKSQISPELTEFLIRRNLGSGLIGTVSLLLGVMLAAIGAIRLEDDDYGKPKLRVGPVAVDVSQIFGTSSLLAGAAFVSTIKDGDGFVKAMDNTLDVMLDGFFLTDIMNLDLYSGGGTFATGLDFLESAVLSFIPNAFAYVAGATYTGELKKNNLLWKACAKIPFLANVVPKKVDPYSGETGGFWDLFNRVVPYVDIEVKSNVSKMSEAVGLSKTQLTGKYTINDESFNLSTHDTAKLNKQYGEWNAKALTDFYSNKSRHRVNVNGTYQELTYNQMTDKQRKAVANNIMTTNANYAKILAWLSKGNKYYASDAEYEALRKLGVKGNLYKGNRGFVKA